METFFEVGHTYKDKMGREWKCIAIDEYAWLVSTVGNAVSAFSWYLDGRALGLGGQTYNILPPKPRVWIPPEQLPEKVLEVASGWVMQFEFDPHVAASDIICTYLNSKDDDDA